MVVVIIVVIIVVAVVAVVVVVVVVVVVAARLRRKIWPKFRTKRTTKLTDVMNVECNFSNIWDCMTIFT